jgi:hypothetical protein
MQNGGFISQYWRVGGACGIAFAVCFIVGAALSEGEPPTWDDPPAEIRAFWADDGQAYLAGDYIIGLGFMLFFFPFLSALTSVLGAAEGGSRMWSRIVFGGGVLFLALAAAQGIFWTTLAFGDVAENLSDESLTLLMTLDVGAQHFPPAALAIMVLPASLVILLTRVLPLWLGVLALIEGVLGLLGPLAILADNPNDSVLSFLAFPGAGIWILITGIVLILKKEAPAVAAAAA